MLQEILELALNELNVLCETPVCLVRLLTNYGNSVGSVGKIGRRVGMTGGIVGSTGGTLGRLGRMVGSTGGSVGNRGGLVGSGVLVGFRDGIAVTAGSERVGRAVLAGVAVGVDGTTSGVVDVRSVGTVTVPIGV